MAKQTRARNSSRRSAPLKQSSTGWRWLKRIIVVFAFLGFLAVGGLAMAVWTTMNSLPTFSSLKASEHGQTIVVHRRNRIGHHRGRVGLERDADRAGNRVAIGVGDGVGEAVAGAE